MPAVSATQRDASNATCPRIADNLKLIHDSLPISRRLLRAGDTVYEAGERFESLHVVNSGFFKLVFNATLNYPDRK